jgi:hypothetical protein
VRGRLLFIVLLIAGVLAPAIGAYGAQQQTPARGLGIRLLDAPADRANDPRAQSYIIDHLKAGASIERHIEVSNGTDHDANIDVYPVAAQVKDGAFVADNGRGKNELAEWITVQPSTLPMKTGTVATVTVRIAVPSDATPGERYAAVLAELPPTDVGSGVSVGSRIGIRVYLSVGSGSEPASDFTVDKLIASRSAQGLPEVRATVGNTGGRALDLVGKLALDHGPGGLSAGPFDSVAATTLQPGASDQVVIPLDRSLPNGPWDASLTMRSGRLQRTVTATITFPDAGEPAKAFEVDRPDKGIATIVALLLLLAVLLGLLLFWWRRRRKRREDEEPVAA